MPKNLAWIKDWSERTISFGLHITQLCRPNLSQLFMQVPLEVTQGWLQPITDLRSTFIGKEWRRMWTVTLSNAPHASKPNTITPISRLTPATAYTYWSMEGSIHGFHWRTPQIRRLLSDFGGSWQVHQICSLVKHPYTAITIDQLFLESRQHC